MNKSLVIDLTVILLEICGIINEISRGFTLHTFQFYTSLSNYFALIVCILSVCFQIRSIRRGISVPVWMNELKFMDAVCLCITFMIVAFIFGPMSGSLEGTASMLFSNDWKYRHFACPILLFIDNLLFENDSQLPEHGALLAVLPTFFYAVIAIILNAVYIWQGPYPFLMVHEQSLLASVLWFILIIGGAFLIALLMKKLRYRN